MISLSSAAITQLHQMIGDEGGQRGLRLQVDKGGCAGWQYTMKLDHPGEQDHVFAEQGVAVIVDDESLLYLRGSFIDYLDNLNDSGFKVVNPNAARSCGCGTSFEPAAR